MTPSDALIVTIDIQIILLAIYVVALGLLWKTNFRPICWHAIVASLFLALLSRFVRGDAQKSGLLPDALRFLDPFTFVLLLLVLNLGIAWHVIRKTGGSHRSPFSHFYFTLPILTLILTLPPVLVYSYAGLALLAFTTTIASEDEIRHLDNPEYYHLYGYDRLMLRIAFWTISVISFYLAFWVHTRTPG